MAYALSLRYIAHVQTGESHQVTGITSSASIDSGKVLKCGSKINDAKRKIDREQDEVAEVGGRKEPRGLSADKLHRSVG